MVDGTQVTPANSSELSRYIMILHNVEPNLDGGVTIDFTYKGDENWTDFSFIPVGGYVLQGMTLTGETDDVEVTAESGAYALEGVPDGSTLTLYLRTPYSVEYHVPEGIEAPEDDADYIVPKDNDVTEETDGFLWTNGDLETEITLAGLDGLNGWYTDETCTGTPSTGNVDVSEDLADHDGVIHFYAKPAVPSEEAIEAALGDSAVTVDCGNEDAKHEDVTYGLLAGSATVGDQVTWDGTTYTVQVTLAPDNYVEQYSAEMGLRHYLQEGQSAKTVDLVWKDGGWTAAEGTLPIRFTVLCDESGSLTNDTEFHIMGLEKIKEAVAEDQNLTNTNDIEIYTIYVHGTKNALPGNGKATGGVVNEYGLTVKPDEGRPGRNGMLVNGQDAWKIENTVDVINDDTVSSITIYAKVDGEKVTVSVPKSDFDVKHLTDADSHITQIILKDKSPEIPEEPGAPEEEEIPDIVGTGAVKIDCTNTSVSHADGNYDILPNSEKEDPTAPNDSFDIGEVTGSAETGYQCEITVYPAPYVTKYNQEVADGHTLSPDTQESETITLVWDEEEGWATVNGKDTVTFTVDCTKPQTMLEIYAMYNMDVAQAKQDVVKVYSALVPVGTNLYGYMEEHASEITHTKSGYTMDAQNWYNWDNNGTLFPDSKTMDG